MLEAFKVHIISLKKMNKTHQISQEWKVSLEDLNEEDEQDSLDDLTMKRSIEII